MQEIEKRLAALGLALPTPPPAAGAYLPYLRSGSLVFIAGQTCHWNGVLRSSGRIGEEISLEEGQQAARLCGLNILSHLKNACGGDLDRVQQCLRLTVFVKATEHFSEHAQIANGVSDLMVDVLGPRGRHTRSTVGVQSLPLQTSVEVDGIFEVRV